MTTTSDPQIITENISTVKFKDITSTFADNYRKIAALSATGELYIWGKDTNIADMTTNSCSVTWESVNFNLCQATKITTTNSNIPTDLTFEWIKSGLRTIIALGNNGKYYKIEQPKTKKIQVTEIVVPVGVLSIDLTSNGTVVYVTSDNKLISTHFDSMDTTFKNTINSMSWKSIKVLEDTNNSMCGLNKDNQMYCWGVQSYTDGSVDEKNTFMLPIFNTNLYDLTKDYLVAEGGGTSSILTNMTSGVWDDDTNDTDNKGAFVIRYPTYIGGFNYEVIFK